MSPRIVSPPQRPRFSCACPAWGEGLLTSVGPAAQRLFGLGESGAKWLQINLGVRWHLSCGNGSPSREGSGFLGGGTCGGASSSQENTPASVGGGVAPISSSVKVLPPALYFISTPGIRSWAPSSFYSHCLCPLSAPVSSPLCSWKLLPARPPQMPCPALGRCDPAPPHFLLVLWPRSRRRVPREPVSGLWL